MDTLSNGNIGVSKKASPLALCHGLDRWARYSIVINGVRVMLFEMDMCVCVWALYRQLVRSSSTEGTA